MPCGGRDRTGVGMPINIGTSGWHYEHWDRGFYPAGLPRRRWLEHYAARFRTVESNAAFYRLPARDTFASWASQTPEDFVMAVKMSRYLTHIRRLREPAEPVQRFLERADALGAKLGPVLLQLPPTLQADPGALRDVLEALCPAVRVAVEFRHPSWFTDGCLALLEEHGAALCLADRGSRPVTPLERTTGWGYVRLHFGTGNPESCYGRAALASWSERVAGLWGPEEEVFVYFNNDTNRCALRDARTFHLACARIGLHPTRVPAAREVRLR